MRENELVSQMREKRIQSTLAELIQYSSENA